MNTLAPARAFAPSSLWGSLVATRWEFVVAGIGVAGAVAAFWITIDAHFLRYPPWLAVQKADFILGPIGVGLYWRCRRPNNRLGLLLIALGLGGIPYILESTTVPSLFGVGVLWEAAIYVMTSLVILAYPSGRLDGRPERVLIAVVLVGVVLTQVVMQLTAPHSAPGFTISGCRAACPTNGIAIWSTASWWAHLQDIGGVGLIAVPLATAALLVWRFVTGTPPRRRAMAIGAPIALLFLLTQATYRTTVLISPGGRAPSGQTVQGVIQWTFAGARSFLWYGFLFALIAADLYAVRVLRRLVRQSLAHPSLPELQPMLRGPLGDPSLRLGFWRASTWEWTAGNGKPLAPPDPGQALTEVERDGRPAAAIVHDKQLSENPELLQAAGAVALLALENAELELAWKESLHELADSRSRIVKASDRERQKLERDLHDGAQQRLLAALLKLSLATEVAPADSEMITKLTGARMEVEAGIRQLRELAHGIYPTALRDLGLAGALRDLAARSAGSISVVEAADANAASETAAAMYYCSLEAIQNVAKHAGPDAHAVISLYASAQELCLEVRDDGRGFHTPKDRDGVGVQNMRDRLGAVGGQVEIVSEPGHGTTVTAAVPLN